MTSKSIISPHKTDILNKLQYQGESNDCGPTTAATVVNALRNTNLDALELSKRMNKPGRIGCFPVIRRIPNWATFPWGMVDVFKEHGLEAAWGFNRSSKYLRERLERGVVLMPIIGSWKPLWAHVMVLLVCTAGHHWGFANTQYKQRQIYWVRDEIFQQQWRAVGRLLVEINWGDNKNLGGTG